MSNQDSQTGAHLWRLLRYAWPYRKLVVLTILCSLIYAVGAGGRLLLVQPLLDDVGQPASLAVALESGRNTDVDPEEAKRQSQVLRARADENFWKIAWFGALLILIMPLVRVVRDYSGEWIMTRLLVDLQAAVGHRMVELPLSRHQQDKRGEYLARMSSDTFVANRVQALVYGEWVQDAAMVLVALGGMLYLNWRLSLVFLVVAPPTAVVMQVFGKRVRKSARARQEQNSEVLQRVSQYLAGIKVIKAFRAEEREHSAFRAEVMRYFRRSMKVIRNRVYARSIIEFFSQAAFVSMLLVGVYSIINTTMGLTMGTLAAYLMLAGMTYRPAKNLTRLYNAVQDAMPSAERLFEIIDAPGEVADAPDAVDISSIEGGIRYRDVSFSYGRESVLSQINLEIKVGETVALVGRTGAGKTTIADLLLRFYELEKGSIEINGIDIRKIRRASLRGLAGVVTQQAFLFDTTILENIRYGKPEASFDEVKQAAIAANAHEFIETLPEQYETRVGEDGTQLSGGQRQRLTIARAILRDPQLLIFDEATSALDAKAEQKVQEAIRNLMRDRTVLVIAHRLSTVQAADRIAVIEDGHVTATGTHDDLMQTIGLYSELVQIQLAPPAPNAA